MRNSAVAQVLMIMQATETEVAMNCGKIYFRPLGMEHR
jgi:hypothetical protein